MLKRIAIYENFYLEIEILIATNAFCKGTFFMLIKL